MKRLRKFHGANDDHSDNSNNQLELVRTMRGSSAVLDVMCISTFSGNLFTVDRMAIRLWSSERQLKTHHFLPESKASQLRAVHALHLKHIDAFMVVYSVQDKPYDEFDQSDVKKGGLIQIWSPALHMLCEFSLEYLSFGLVNFGQTLYQTAVLIDSQNKAIILHFDYPSSTSLSKPCHDESGIYVTQSLSDARLPAPRSAKAPVCAVRCREVQIMNDGFEKVVDCLILDAIEKTTIMFLSDSNVSMWSRKSTRIDSGETAASQMSAAAMDVSYFEFLGKFDVSTGACNIRSMAPNIFALGFRDGYVRILRSENAETVEVLAEMQAHTPRDKFSHVFVEKCEWIQPMHLFNMISIGSDKRVVYWGFSRKASTLSFCTESESYSSPILLQTDDDSSNMLQVLGERNMIVDPPSHVLSEKSLRQRSRLGRLITFEKRDLENPTSKVRRQIGITVGGMICILTVHAPFRCITSTSSPAIKWAICGPTRWEGRISTTPCTTDDLCTSLVLQDQMVTVLDLLSGSTLYEMDITQLGENFAAPLGTIATIPPKSPLGYIQSNTRHGLPTTLFWCQISKQIIIGFSNGGIALMSGNFSDSRETSVRTLQSRKAHDCAIVRIATFLRQPAVNGKRSVCVMAGDNSGVLSVWSAIDSSSMLWCSQAHQGPLIFIGSVEEGPQLSSLPILVSACTTGSVKIWIQHLNGELLLGAFFNCSSPPLTSVLTPIIVPTETLNESWVDCEDVLSSSQSSSPSKSKLENIVDNLHPNILCVCGTSSGNLEGWVLSTNSSNTTALSPPSGSRTSFPAPTWTNKIHSAPISAIHMFLKEKDCQFLCASSDGTISLIEVSSGGRRFQRLTYASVPFPIHSILSCRNSAVQAAPGSFYVCTNRYIAEISIMTGLKSPPFGKQSIQPVSHTQLQPAANNMGILSEGPIDYIVANGTGEHISEAPVDTESNLDEVSSDALEKYDDGGLYVGQMHAMQRAITAELYFAKKDRLLLDLFRKMDEYRVGTISVTAAVNIIHKWLQPSDILGSESIWELMQLLGVHHDAKLQFIKVAKIAAIAASATKKQVIETSIAKGFSASQSSTWSNYRSLQSKRKHVSYNSMGERVFDVTEFERNTSDGIANGYASSVQELWKKQFSRILGEKDVFQVPAPQTMLRKLPQKFSRLISKDVELPSTWEPSNAHWFDLRRTVRVARTLLDMRCSSQHELVYGKSKKSTAEHLPRLLIRYFERNYGASRLNVANYKIVYYLEACMQYRQWPIVDFIQNFLCPEPTTNEPHDDILWVYTELRNLLLARSCVVEGEIIPTIDITGDTSSSQMKWLNVSRVDALAAVDEMFRVRGGYGHGCVKRLLALVDALPSTESKGTVYIDFEYFLGAVAFEFQCIQRLIKEYDDLVFGIDSVPIYRPATARDITTDMFGKQIIDVSMRNANVSLSLGRIRALILQFILNDIERKGTLDQVTFRSIVINAGDAILGFNCGRDAHKLVDECIRMYRGSDPNSDVSYVDFWATLIAYVSQFQGGDTGLDGNEAFIAIKNVKRGLEEKQAMALASLLKYIQSPPKTDARWTVGRQEGRVGLMIPTSGTWSKETIVAQPDRPGTLITMQISHQKASKYSLSDLVDSEHVVVSSPTVLETLRENETIFGEVSRNGSLKKHPITAAELHSTELSQSVSGLSFHNSSPIPSSSYSRSIQELDEDRYSNSSGDARVADPLCDLYTRETASVDASTPQASSHQSGASAFEHKSMTLQIATQSIERQRAQMVSDEIGLHKLQLAEEAAFIRRRNMQNEAKIKARKEMMKKEKISMAFKRKADNEREARTARSKAFLEKIQHDDEQAMLLKKELANQKLNQTRERARKQREDRLMLENIERERRKETEENTQMGIEDRLSHDFELSLAEKLRKSKEISDMMAASELQKKMREAEKLRLEEERRRLEAEKLAKEAALAAEYEVQMSEIRLMMGEDFNAFKPLLQESKIVDSQLVEPEIVPKAPAPVAYNTAIERKMQKFLSKMRVVNERHFQHPRYISDGCFYMPQALADDIHFDPFSSSCSDVEGRLDTSVDRAFGSYKTIGTRDRDKSAAADSKSTIGDYKDISQAIRAHKQQLLLERMEQLYRTSSTETSSEDWTSLWKLDSVNWRRFFELNRRIIHERPKTPELLVDEENTFIEEMKSRNSVVPLSQMTNDFPDSLPVPCDDIVNKLTPLPFGKVQRATILPGQYEYYQVEVVDIAIVTIELKVKRGIGTIYVSDVGFPTIANYSFRAVAEPHNNRIARVVFKPQKSGTHFVGIHTDDGAKYEVWAFCSGPPLTEANSTVGTVANKLRMLEILSNHSETDLHANMQSLLLNAQSIVDFEVAHKRSTILSEYNQAQAENSHFTARPDDDMDDATLMDKFVAKAGRRLIRKDLLTTSAASRDSECERLNPNAHPELFLKPKLSSEKDFLALISVEKLNESESLRFSMMETSKRHKLNATRPSNLPKLDKTYTSVAAHDRVTGGPPIQTFVSSRSQHYLPSLTSSNERKSTKFRQALPTPKIVSYTLPLNI